ncbi:MAG: hypothetical protein NUK63_07775 [Candidatus Bathyarchaeum tardum]|nr:MAG: hypothetical protein NUK63_07775 [Candidatus Bathyarchaeum tardum]
MKLSASLFALLLFLPVVLPALLTPLVWATEDSWTTVEPMPTLRENFELVAMDRKIYAIGGSNSSQQVYYGTNEEYDLASDTWVTKEPMPTPRSGFGTFVFQDKIYCICGYSKEESYLGVNEVYDPIMDIWETKASLPTNRSGMQTKMVDGKIYVLGGAIGYNYEKSETIYSQVNEAYNPVTDSWERKTSIPVNGEFTAHVFGDHIYCIFKDSIWVYDTTDDSWTQKFTMPIPAAYSYYTVAIENSIYFLVPSEGGYNQIYNVKNDVWIFGKNLPIELNQPNIVATTGKFAPRRIYVVGGFTGFVDPTDTTYVYNPEEDDWNLGASMGVSRYNIHLIVVDDILYAVGGAIGFLVKPVSVTATVEKYIPSGYIPEFPSGILLVVGVSVVVMLSIFFRLDFKLGRKK